MIRYVRAFMTALQMTLRGEEIPHVDMRRWLDEAARYIDTVERTASVNPEKVVLRIEGRDVSMAHILAALRYHITEEYPYLLRHPTEHNFTAIYASNMNDQFWTMKLEAAPELQDKQTLAAVTALRQHLEAIPSQSSASA